ncbi:hypothetical protein RB623_22660 [Mesorhizobium sp. LHD-90]|uniref:hypothetical protein n=1 Tax=Mesorhizobium sp. LHD-90 TaxID=3071414 RepID=UPI0027E12106|nr:hypothetical protein [Mesorhizobium sp. LHD-90]MDQ6436861.1 hypothetical protein [Mesorhizobium sp. LHD-90]
MSASDFRDIVVKGDAGKAERLFRAAVSAFCSITRPSRREVAQLEDLTLPLFDQVSAEARRYVAAALSECEIAPAGLVARLADERIDVAAPLLMRSAHLRDVDLIALIGKHGIAHARVIARRPSLNPTIAQLVRALEASISVVPRIVRAAEPAPKPAQPGTLPLQDSGHAAEEVRDRLREMMRSDLRSAYSLETRVSGDNSVFPKLRDTAFTGNDTFFQTALADALGMNLAAARAITEASSYSSLLAALRALDLSEEQAFMIAAAVFPGQFAHAEAIRMFAVRYRALDYETARERVRGWKLEIVATWLQWSSAAGRGRRAARSGAFDTPAATGAASRLKAP